jgi:hypothetical protein
MCIAISFATPFANARATASTKLLRTACVGDLRKSHDPWETTLEWRGGIAYT